MGLCWHEPVTMIIDGQMFYICKHCGMMPVFRPDKFITPNFSEWLWFEYLHEWTRKNPYFMELFLSEFSPYNTGHILSPDLYADLVYNFLVQKEQEQQQTFFDKIKNKIGLGNEKD